MSSLILLILIVTGLLWLNIKATIIIARDAFSEPMQGRLQMLMVWLLPMIGALIVLAVHRSSEEASRRYQEQSSIDDEIESTVTASEIDHAGSDGADGE